MYSIGKHVRIGCVFTLFGDVYSDLICGGVSNSMLQLSGVLKWSYNVFGGKGIICYGGGLTISIMFGSFIENFNPNKSCQYFILHFFDRVGVGLSLILFELITNSSFKFGSGFKFGVRFGSFDLKSFLDAGGNRICFGILFPTFFIVGDYFLVRCGWCRINI